MHWFGEIYERNNKTKLGKALRTFNKRILGGIRLSIDETDSNTQRHKFQFKPILSTMNTLSTFPSLGEFIRKTSKECESLFKVLIVLIVLTTNDDCFRSA